MIRGGLMMVLIALSACGEGARETPAPRSEPAAPAAAPASPRVDGVYWTEPREWNGATRIHWMRFYADGRIIEGTTGPEGRPEEVAAWFDWGHADARQRGRYEVADGHVRVETLSPAAHHIGHGTLGRDAITFQWRDRTNDREDTRRFRFAPIAAWAAATE
jgi:hypothetical protein